jgi:hypothetical protein
LFRALYSIHIHRVPSFFLTKTTKEANGLELGRMWPIFNNSLMVF